MQSLLLLCDIPSNTSHECWNLIFSFASLFHPDDKEINKKGNSLQALVKVLKKMVSCVKQVIFGGKL